MTNFQRVSFFNELIGNTPQRPNDNWDKANTQFQLIQEEFDELMTALAERDVTKLRDAIADVLVTTYGLAYITDVNADADMLEVHRSNMGKFCHSIEEVEATIEQYRLQGVVGRSKKKKGLWAIVSTQDQHDNTGKFFPKGKLLKSVQYFEPEFSNDF